MLHLDGPRSNADTKNVEACKQLFDEFAIHTKHSLKLYSDTNQGLKKNVIISVSRAFQNFDSENLLILEDDCLLGPGSLGFFEWGFQKLASEEKLGVVSGTYFGKTKPNKAFTASRFSSWGWGTTQKAWLEFMASDYSNTDLDSLSRDVYELTKKDPLPYRYEYSRITRNLGKLDSWAIPFDLFLRREALLTIKPCANQIQNIGFGDNATHTSRGSSLSIPTGELEIKHLQLADPDKSKGIEKAEAWVKFRRLASELLFPWLIRERNGPFSR